MSTPADIPAAPPAAPTPTPAAGAPSGGATPPTPGPAPQRPEGISETEWAALGDPGKAALVRERERATTAERELAAARRTPPAPPAPPTPPATPPAAPQGGQQGGQQGQPPTPPSGDVGELTRLVTELLGREQARETEAARSRALDAVEVAARDRFHDTSDAVAHVDLAAVVGPDGRVDPAKVTTELDALLVRKPHLGRVVDPRRFPVPGTPIGGSAPPALSEEERVKKARALMDSPQAY